MRKDYYQILGLPRNADEQSIKRAYRALAKQYHPDMNHSIDAQDKFLEINEAYEFLIDPNNRRHAFEPTVSEWKQKEYENEEYQRFREELKEKARRRAQKRYEEIVKQQEAWQKSGLNDLSILAKLVFRLALIALPCTFLFKILLQFVNFDYDSLVAYSIILIITSALTFFIFKYWNSLFKKTDFYYTLPRLRKLFFETVSPYGQCFYSKNTVANSPTFTLELIKLKDIKLEFSGYRQQRVNYKSEVEKVEIPRSMKAFRVHILCSIIKIVSILSFTIFLSLESFLWKVLLGLFLGEVITQLISLTFNIRLSTTYLYSWGMLIKMTIWMIPILLCTSFSFHPFDIYTSDLIHLALFLLLLFDCFLEQFIYSVLGRKFMQPFTHQPARVHELFNNGYRLYNEIPVFSVLYPLSKWLVG